MAKVLVIGGGGREHAIAWKLSKSEDVGTIFAAPGNPGIARVPKAKNASIDIKCFETVAKFCKDEHINMVVVGPEDPLANGIADFLLDSGIKVFGPQRAAAIIESDKAWAKKFMDDYGIPTAGWKSFTDAQEAKSWIAMNPNYNVVKASGLAAGKGVLVARNTDDACRAIDDMMVDRIYGEAGNEVLLEKQLHGEECSMLAFCDGENFKIMMPAQDHKRLKECDEGPNTGGMGVICPVNVPGLDMEDVKKFVFERAMLGFKDRGIKYVGVLYAGLMITKEGIQVLEFNCRFGDPETEVLLPLLESDLYKIMMACCTGTLNSIEVKFRSDAYSLGVIFASEHYPLKGSTNQVIKYVEHITDDLVFHCGTATNEKGELVTKGGRILIVVSVGSNLLSTKKYSMALCRKICFDGVQYRRDIGNVEVARYILKHGNLSYKNCGVDISAGNDLVSIIKPLAKSTYRPGVMGDLGGYAGIFNYKEAGFNQPVFVGQLNFIGTKLKIAEELDKHHTIGLDLVATCANDILAYGAEPLFFLDYFACSHLDINITSSVIKGIAEACRQTGCCLIGGETAEMPGFYRSGSYDVHGFMVGAFEKTYTLKRDIADGDVVIGLPSKSLHNGGFPIIDKVMKAANLKYADLAPFSESGLSFGEEFLTPTKNFVKAVLKLKKELNMKAFAHVTERGLARNISSVLPDNFGVNLDMTKWTIPDVFGWLAAECSKDEDFPKNLDQFNFGIGAVIIVAKEDEEKALQILADIDARSIGAITSSKSDKFVEINNMKLALEPIIDKYQPKIESVIPTNIVYKGSSTEDSLSVFGTTFEIPEEYGPTEPFLLAGTDGVGTKIKFLLRMKEKLQGLAHDLLGMCINDLLAHGARPLAFTYCIASDTDESQRLREFEENMKKTCKDLNCKLLPQKTAIIPEVYFPEKFDLSGFAVGFVQKNRLMPKLEEIKEGDAVIALRSTGPHSNGYSMLNRIFTPAVIHQFRSAKDDKGINHLFNPTQLYVEKIEGLRGKAKAFAHITGGGLVENVPRVLPSNLGVQLDFSRLPASFLTEAKLIAIVGNVNAAEMLRTFNCGIGGIVIIENSQVESALSALGNNNAAQIGQVVKAEGNRQVLIENFESTLASLMAKDLAQVMTQQNYKKKVAVLISGTGTNLQALISAIQSDTKDIPAEIVLVISNVPGVRGLKIAEDAHIPTIVLNHKNFKSRQEYDAQLDSELRAAGVEIICLAGFMRILSPQFVSKWRGRLINIHPSLLPKFKGLHAQKQALEAGEKVSGCTVHFVEEDVDAGAIITQEIVPIEEGDTEEILVERIKTAEHIAYPRALKWLASDKLILGQDNKIQHLSATYL